MNAMNVLIVMPLGEYGGGAEQMLHTYLSSRERSGAIQLHLLFLSSGGLANAARGMGYPVAIIPAGRVREVSRLLKVQVEVGRLLDKWGIERVLAWMPKACLYTAMPTKRRGIPLFSWRHDIPVHLSHLDTWLMRYHRPAGLACSSRRACRALQQSAPRASNMTTIHPGTSPLSFDPTAVYGIRQSVLGHGDGIIIGTIARLQPWKRIDLFLRAVALLRRDVTEVRALVVGGESHGLSKGYAEKLYELGRHLLGDAVYFAGEQRHVGDWLEAMDLFVLASEGEPFGIVLIEALAAGKPVVACAGGGPEEIIDDATVGIILPNDPSPEEMASAMRSLVTPASLASAKTLNPVRGQHFSPSGMAISIDRWLQTAL